jgi:Fe-S oxidoreductase
MKIGLFIPCYVDAFFTEVGIATLELLERFGCSIEYPVNQTCRAKTRLINESWCEPSECPP